MKRRCQVTEVLRRLDTGPGDAGWRVDVLCAGSQAVVYRATARDGRVLDEGRPSLIVKLYRDPAAGAESATVKEECEALTLLGASLEDLTVSGWKVVCPRLVASSTDPPALVLTQMPGLPLQACLDGLGDNARDFVDTVAEAYFEALRSFWRLSKRPYGDAHFANVLCDPKSRTLSLVDPGKPKPLFDCSAVSADFYPESRDLAYLLYDTGVANARRPWQKQPAARRLQMMRTIFNAYRDSAELNGRAESFWREVDACVQVHIDSMRCRWFPKNVWQSYLRATASRQILSFCSAFRRQ